MLLVCAVLYVICTMMVRDCCLDFEMFYVYC